MASTTSRTALVVPLVLVALGEALRPPPVLRGKGSMAETITFILITLGSQIKVQIAAMALENSVQNRLAAHRNPL